MQGPEEIELKEVVNLKEFGEGLLRNGFISATKIRVYVKMVEAVSQSLRQDALNRNVKLFVLHQKRFTEEQDLSIEQEIAEIGSTFTQLKTSLVKQVPRSSWCYNSKERLGN